ncbi:isoleucine--tRNA ligase [Candidatus Spongiihabitans sp.]|uniref:isoleucine--tRNA ligase n=1 Tax=Candidatus Spongiihabitans sp. TaxID=3101308 RepID=UPI003C7EB20E
MSGEKNIVEAQVFDEVQGRYNGPQLEQRILKFWEEHAIFEKSLAQSACKPRFSFNEGPPTANGKPGIHHVLARAFKDIYPRYKTMRGYYAPRKGGWDTHGLPVEHEIEKQLGIFDKKEIESQVGVAEFNRRCRESVMTYIGEWERMTRRMGYWVNLDQAYYTLDNDYIESTWNLLKRIWDKGLIYKGYKVVPYDPRIGATLSSHEVAQGYREVEDPSITVRFRLAGEDNTSLLVWTTTPWTLPSNLLLAVGADIDYARVACGDEILIMARARVEATLADAPHEIIDTVKGSALVGRRYQRLFDYLTVESGDCFRVVAADFVSTEDGTGIVHTAPAYGVDDLDLAKREGLPVLHGVGLDGCFVAEVTPLAGKFFKDADPIIIEMLSERGLMFRAEKMVHNYPFGWRTGDPLIYYAKEAWYIKTTAIKDRMVALNKTINWVPETIRDGRFGNWLENNVDWALSRERFWGTPLPLWSDGEGDFICVGSVQELETLTGQSLTDLDLHRPQIDQIKFTKAGREYRRVPEVIDCWFDSGAMTYAQWHYPFENQDLFEKHFPADYICEAIDQTRGWFYTLHAIAALVDDSVAYKNCVCLSHIVDEHGKKMSKSQGNIVNPYDVFDTIGADALRWLFLARTAPDAQKRISIDIVREVAATFVNTLWNTYSFFVLYARLDSVDLKREVACDSRPEIDQWILALAHQTIKTATDALDNYDAFAAGQAIEKLIDQLSNWYVRRNRRRFWKSDDGDDKQSAYLTLYECLDIAQRIVAPFMPFLSEAMYQNLSKCDERAKPSVHLAPWPEFDPARLNDKLVFEMDVVQTIVGLGRSAREQSRVRVRQPLSRILVCVADAKCPQGKATQAAARKHSRQIREELNVKTVQFIESDAELVSFTVAPNFPRLGRRYGKLMPAIKAALASADSAVIVRRVQQQRNFELEIDGRRMEFEPEDIQVQTASAAGYASSSADGCLVALDTSLDHALIIEGLARELVRTVQDARKSAGLEISDRIALDIIGTDQVLEALQQHRDYIMTETLALELRSAREKSDDEKITSAVDGKLDHGFRVNRSLGDDSWQIVLARQ